MCIYSDQRNALATPGTRRTALYGPVVKNCIGVGGPSSISPLLDANWTGILDVSPASQVTASYTSPTTYTVTGADVRGFPYYYNSAGYYFVATYGTTKRKFHKILSATLVGSDTVITIDPLTDDGGSNYDYLMTDTPVTLRMVHKSPTVSIDADYRRIVEPLILDNIIQLGSGNAPSAAIPGYGQLFIQTSGGKQQLCIRFSSGAVQVISTEP